MTKKLYQICLFYVLFLYSIYFVSSSSFNSKVVEKKQDQEENNKYKGIASWTTVTGATAATAATAYRLLNNNKEDASYIEPQEATGAVNNIEHSQSLKNKAEFNNNYIYNNVNSEVELKTNNFFKEEDKKKILSMIDDILNQIDDYLLIDKYFYFNSHPYFHHLDASHAENATSVITRFYKLRHVLIYDFKDQKDFISFLNDLCEKIRRTSISGSHCLTLPTKNILEVQDKILNTIDARLNNYKEMIGNPSNYIIMKELEEKANNNFNSFKEYIHGKKEKQKRERIRKNIRKYGFSLGK